MSDRFYGTSYDDDQMAHAIMASLSGANGRGLGDLGFTGRTVMLPEDYLKETQKASLGQYPSGGYSYYGSPYPGAQPQQTSDWDKFMQFNAIVAPVVGQVLGTWMQSRAQIQTATQQKEAAVAMANALQQMPPEQQAQMMEAYMVNQMLANAGQPTQMNQSQMAAMGQALQSMPSGQFNQAYNTAFGNLQGAAAGNANILASLNRTGAQLRGGGGFSIPGWVIVGGLAAGAAVIYFGFIEPKRRAG